MATRKIKDARDNSTNELIYFKGHAGATFMSNGATVEDAINNLSVRTTEDYDVDLSNYYTKNEIDSIGFLRAQDIEGLQEEITDLETIRSGAAKGATALQSIPSEYVTESELENKGYLTQHQSLSEYAKLTDVEAMINEVIITTLNTEV